MTDKLIEMAVKAGFSPNLIFDAENRFTKFANLIRSDERDRIALKNPMNWLTDDEIDGLYLKSSPHAGII